LPKRTCQAEACKKASPTMAIIKSYLPEGNVGKPVNQKILLLILKPKALKTNQICIVKNSLAS